MDETNQPGSSEPGLGKAGQPTISEASSKVAVLVLLSDKKKSKDEATFRLNKDRIMIGSVESADVTIGGEGVAPVHAVIELNPQSDGSVEAILFDMASDSGIKVNGRKMVSGEIKPGDKLKIGPHELKFFVEDLEKASKEVSTVKAAKGRKLFIDPDLDLKPLILQSAEDVDDIFDYSDISRGALEVVMSWKGTILDVGHFVRENSVTVGDTPRSHFGIPSILSSHKYPIVTNTGDGFVLNVGEHMGGVIQRRGELNSIAELRESGTKKGSATQIPLSYEDFAKVSIGDIDFYVSYTPAPPKLKRRKTFEKDAFFFKTWLFSMLFTLFTMFTLYNITVEDQVEAEKLPERIATVIYTPEKYSPTYRPIVKRQRAARMARTPIARMTRPRMPRMTKIEIKPGQTKLPRMIPKTLSTSGMTRMARMSQTAMARASVMGRGGKEGEGARKAGPKGTRGSRMARTMVRATDVAQRKSPRGGRGRGGGRSQVGGPGNLDALKGATSTIKNLLGGSTDRLGPTGKRLKGIGGFTGRGSGGSAISGTGTGGGGSSVDGLGLGKKGYGAGRVGTGPGASGTGEGIVAGRGRVDIRAGDPYDVIRAGNIDAAAVEAAILRHKDEFRYCYEKELNAGKPNLQGRVSTSFVIDRTGKAYRSGIISTSLRSPRVERCVLKVLKRIQFPRPKGGGTVEVAYPFKFRPIAQK